MVKEPEVPATDDWDAVGEGWETADTNIGKQVVWPESPVFRGLYKGRTEVANKEGELIVAHLFKDEHAEERFAWGTPELTFGLQNVPFGSQVVVTWNGKEALDEKRTINRFHVQYKRPWPSGLAAGSDEQLRLPQ